MSRQEDRRRKAQMLKDQARAGRPQPPTMEVPILGEKKTLKNFVQSVDELELLGDLVLIREISQKQTEGGIILPDGSREEGPRKGVVAAVGKGAMREDGSYMPMQVTVGDLVYLTLGVRPAGMQIGGEPYQLVPDSAIMIKVRKPSQEVMAGGRKDASVELVTE